MTDKSMITTIDELKALKAQKSALEGEIKALEETIKEEMTRRQEEELSVGPHKIFYKVIVSGRIDSKALKEKAGDIYRKFYKETIGMRLTVK